jgi:hypothetical protein
VDFKNARKQDLSGKYTDINKRGGMDKYEWKTEYYPDLYDFKDNGEGKAPTMTTKTQPSGLKDESGAEVPMLSDDAYGFFKTLPSNVVAINKKLKRQYGKDFDPTSSEAETLRKIEAYKKVESEKPKINANRVDKEDPVRSFAFNFGSGFGQGGVNSQINNVYQRVKTKLAKRQGQGQEFLPASLLEQDEKDEVLKIARNAKGDNDITQDELKLIEGNDGSVRIFDNKDNFIAFMGETGTNLPRQADVIGKRAVVEKANQKQDINKPKTVRQNGHTYTLDEKTGEYK